MKFQNNPQHRRVLVSELLGFCYNVGEWNFPDAPLRGLYYRNSVYQGVIGMESFAPWLERLEKQMNERVFEPVPLDHFAVWVAKLKPMI